MNSDEIRKELAMSYKELVDYLLQKYGPVGQDYFVNETCRSKNKRIVRSGEGLIIHHIDEDKAIMLSDTRWAIKNPFEYQKASRLVYCNIMEHLILHIKIVEEPNPKGANDFEIQGLGGVMNFICPTLNDFYSGYEFKRESDKKALSLVADNFEDYIEVLHYFQNVVAKNDRLILYATNEKLARGWDRSIKEKIYREL